jgi:signal transduction histidine kinase
MATDIDAATPGRGCKMDDGIAVAANADEGFFSACGQSADYFHRTLLAMTGHDLRHQLQIIVSVNSLLLRRLEGQEECEYVAMSVDATLQVIRQLDAILDALRLHERAKQITLSPVSLETLFHNVKREHSRAAQSAGLIFHVVPSHCVVMSDPFLLQGMLRNLIYNAFKYTHRGGKVLVGCRKSPVGVKIEVHDNGIGISQENITRIFDAFKQVDPASSDGLGLGLFIVRRAADSLGHQLDVHSAEGKGSHFAIVIAGNGTTA